MEHAQDRKDMDKAGQYLEAANRYRDMLEPGDQATLDEYLRELARAKAAALPAAAPAAEPAKAAAVAPRWSAPAASPSAPASVASPAGPAQIAPTLDTKQRGRWLLHEAREQIHLGNYDLAQRKVDEAEALDIKWGLFDDTPTKVTEEIKKARPKSVVAKGPTAGQPHDRRAAKARLREARNALNSRQFEQAEAIALEVKGWGLSFGFLEDTPDKVAAAARALRRRDKIRNTPPREQSSQGVYDVLVQESRQLISVGKLDEAETKARQAQRMNVVPALTADRAESVLHEMRWPERRGRHRPRRRCPWLPSGRAWPPNPDNRRSVPMPALRRLPSGRAWPRSTRQTNCWLEETRPQQRQNSPRPSV